MQMHCSTECSLAPGFSRILPQVVLAIVCGIGLGGARIVRTLAGPAIVVAYIALAMAIVGGVVSWLGLPFEDFVAPERSGATVEAEGTSERDLDQRAREILTELAGEN